MTPRDLLDPSAHADMRTPHVVVGMGGLFWRVNGARGEPLARATHITVPGLDGTPMGWLVRVDAGSMIGSGLEESEAIALLLRVAAEAFLGTPAAA
jgi:hypothetical protein